jgi:uncharacterized protein YdaU (DUF1376 family)
MSRAKPSAWMPIYWGDYWADTVHLTASEHGAYLNLIGQYWVRGGALPADDRVLCRLARMTPQEWRRHKDAVLAYFVSVEIEGTVFILSPRVEIELARANSILQSRIKSGKTRAAGQHTVHESGMGAAQESQPRYTPSPSPSPKKERKKKEPLADAPGFADLLAAFAPISRPADPKKASRKAYNAAIASGVSQAVILDGAQRFAARLKRDPRFDRQYTPKLSNWLDNASWDDEPGPAKDPIGTCRVDFLGPTVTL